MVCSLASLAVGALSLASLSVGEGRRLAGARVADLAPPREVRVVVPQHAVRRQRGPGSHADTGTRLRSFWACFVVAGSPAQGRDPAGWVLAAIP